MRNAIPPVCLALVLTAAGLLLQDLAPARASGVSSISAGGAHTCLLAGYGGVFCWGANYVGQIGDDEQCYPFCVSPAMVALRTRATALAAGNGHQCALTAIGGVECWGGSYGGNLGWDPTESCLGVGCGTTPRTVASLSSGVAAITAGVYHTCALTTTGLVKCWGVNDRGQLGTGNVSPPSTTPVDVIGLTGRVSAISANGSHTCALVETDPGAASHALECWGDNVNGQLGNGSTNEHPAEMSASPVDVLNADGTRLSDVLAVAAGYRHTCAITGAGAVKCWGSNDGGQLGTGGSCNESFCPNPLQVVGLTNDAIAVGGGFAHTCALTSAGAVKCWGLNSSGQLGDGNTGSGNQGYEEAIPVNVIGLNAGVRAISVGQLHTCALLDSEVVRCWGDNRSGQIGDGTCDCGFGPPNIARATPTTVIGLMPKAAGDANCDGHVASLDALLILQYSAASTPTLPCAPNSDVNEDARINPVDSMIVLQVEAGLVTL